MKNEILRRQLFMLENDSNRIKNRMTDDHKLNSTMPSNISISREYRRFTSPTKTKNSSSPRDRNTENYFRHNHSPRPMTRVTDYLNERPVFPQSRQVYSPRKVSPNRRRAEPMPSRTSPDRQTRHNEQLEQKFDQLLKKKRDLENRLSRIPIRNLTHTDRQLSDVLEREIERVAQQISSLKLELRRLNILRTH